MTSELYVQRVRLRRYMRETGVEHFDADSTMAGYFGAIDQETRSVEVLASTPDPVEGEALVSWDLERFLDNPVILWAHQSEELPIGRAEDVTVDSAGLKMRVIFATEAANPQAERVWQSVLEGTVRGVSVGYAPGAGSPAPNGTTKRTANELLEVSFVPVPKDEKAVVQGRVDYAGAPADGALWERCVSERMRAMARLDDARPLAYGRGPAGQLRVPARIGRTGVLVYRQSDGITRREYRSDKEAFDSESLASLEGVPLVLPEDHTSLLSSRNWRERAVGFVVNARRAGEFIEADLIIGDEDTAKRVESGDLTELSAGYVSRTEPSTRHDADFEQAGIRYNHVALLPQGRGRAGQEVRVLLEKLSATSGGRSKGADKMDAAELDLSELVELARKRRDAWASKAGK